MKVMVSSWLRDVFENENHHSDLLIKNINRWVSFEGSRLYDHNLKNMLKKLIRRVFRILLRRLESFGAKIVFANQSKLIISTDKDTEEKARQFMNSLTEGISNDPALKYLLFIQKKLWKVLLFKDAYNYGGIDSETVNLFIE